MKLILASTYTLRSRRILLERERERESDVRRVFIRNLEGRQICVRWDKLVRRGSISTFFQLYMYLYHDLIPSIDTEFIVMKYSLAAKLFNTVIVIYFPE